MNVVRRLLIPETTNKMPISSTATATSSTGYGPSEKSNRKLQFNGYMETYKLWETRFLNYLYAMDPTLYKAIMPPVSGEGSDPDFESKNRRAYAELVQLLDDRSLQLIMIDGENNGRASLNILRQHYASTEKPRVLTLYEELTTLSMKTGEDITDYMLRAEKAAVGLNAAGEVISDNLIIAMMLKGLPEEFKSFIVVQTHLDSSTTLSKFKADLRNYVDNEAIRASKHQASTIMIYKNYNNYRSNRQSESATGL